jgi:Ni,Fe-hydrogenase III large subunit
LIPGLQVNSSQPHVSIVRVPPRHLRVAVATVNAMSGARFADLFATSEPLLLRAVYAFDDGSGYLIIEAPQPDQRLPALDELTPSAYVEECELFEQFGLQPAGEALLNRLAVPPHAGGDFPRMAASGVLGENVHTPHVVGGHAFEFPVGPVRGAGQESLYYGLVTSGEEVVDVYLFSWHKHRGIERRLQGLQPDRALFLAERAEGLSAVAVGWAFAAAVETATGTPVNEETLRTRAILLELERLYNHAQCVAALAQSTGLSVGQAQAEAALETLLRVNAAVTGHRYLFGQIAIGGLGPAIDLAPLRAALASGVAELCRVLDALASTNSFLDRLEATGTLAETQARALGLVGPIARAAGLAIDARLQAGVSSYETLRPKIAVREAGDALARFQVVNDEVREAARLIALLVDGELVGTAPSTGTGEGHGLGWTESPRGECLAWVELDDVGRVRRARLRTASVRNWRAFDDAVRAGNVFTDVPIIEASFWLTVAGRAM